jgi:Tat protein secretion system quality control protein TatD with DNase activity
MEGKSKSNFWIKMRKVSLEKQIQIFKTQLEFANKLKKVVTIHCVNEWEKLTRLLLSSEISNLDEKIVLHSFQGKKKDVLKLSNKNLWFSISSGCYCEKVFVNSMLEL